MANDDKIGKLVVPGQQVSAQQVYEGVEKQVGRIRVVYEIRPLQETRPLKKNGPEVFKAGEEIELRIQVWIESPPVLACLLAMVLIFFRV